jgi:bacterioferritin
MRCLSVKDHPSRDLFEELMNDEEGHVDFLETQIELIKRIGVERYCQAHIGGSAKGDRRGSAARARLRLAGGTAQRKGAWP